MAQIKIRVEMNKGRTGAPLEKLGDVARQFERFLRSIAADVQLEVKRGELLAVNFKNGSVSWDAAYQGEVSDALFRRFNSAVEVVVDLDPDTEGTNGIVSDATLLEYGKLGSCIDPDEVISLGLYTSSNSRTPKKWRQINYRQAAQIRHAIEAPFLSHGSVQGILHSLAKEAAAPYFLLREAASAELVRCYYSDNQYRKIVSVLRDRRAMVHAAGEMKLNRATRSVEEIKVERLVVEKPLSEDEFDRLFGVQPDLTGSLSTSQFIEMVRGDGD